MPFIIFVLIMFSLALYAPGVWVLSACAADQSATGQSAGWKQEFNDVCSKTGQSAALSEDELKALIQRCDALESRISRDPDASAKKVYLRRLKTCRGMYSFSLESRQK